MGSGSQVFFKSFKFGPGQDQVPDFAVDVPFGFPGQVVQVIIVDVSHQQQVDDAGVLACGVIIQQIGLFQMAQPGDDAVDDLVHAQ